MLPFMKKDRVGSGLIVKQREPDIKPEQDQDDPSMAIHSCAESLIKAVHASDIKKAAEAIKDAFDILENMPHEEIKDYNFDAENAEGSN